MVMMKLNSFMLFMFQWGGLSCPILTQRATCVAAWEGPSFSPYPATMHPWNKEALNSMREELGGVDMDVVMIKKLKKSDVPNPDNLGFLSQVQLQVVESKTTPAGQMNKVIDYLLEMEDEYFEDFCKILEQGGFTGKAKRLREKAKYLEKIVSKFEYKQHTCKH